MVTVIRKASVLFLTTFNRKYFYYNNISFTNIYHSVSQPVHLYPQWCFHWALKPHDKITLLLTIHFNLLFCNLFSTTVSSFSINWTRALHGNFRFHSDYGNDCSAIGQASSKTQETFKLCSEEKYHELSCTIQGRGSYTHSFHLLIRKNMPDDELEQLYTH